MWGKGPHRKNRKCEDPEAREIRVHLQDRKETSVVPVQGPALGDKAEEVGPSRGLWKAPRRIERYIPRARRKE